MEVMKVMEVMEVIGAKFKQCAPPKRW
jgi:hypothetical protein